MRLSNQARPSQEGWRTPSAPASKPVIRLFEAVSARSCLIRTLCSDHVESRARLRHHPCLCRKSCRAGRGGLVYHGQMFNNFIGGTVEGKLTTDYGVLEGYASNADATIWTFVFKKGIKWHDGVEMTADDLKFSIAHYAEPTTRCGQCGAVRANLDRVEVVNGSTVRLYLKQAD